MNRTGTIEIDWKSEENSKGSQQQRKSSEHNMNSKCWKGGWKPWTSRQAWFLTVLASIVGGSPPAFASQMDTNAGQTTGYQANSGNLDSAPHSVGHAQEQTHWDKARNADFAGEPQAAPHRRTQEFQDSRSKQQMKSECNQDEDQKVANGLLSIKINGAGVQGVTNLLYRNN